MKDAFLLTIIIVFGIYIISLKYKEEKNQKTEKNENLTNDTNIEMPYAKKQLLTYTEYNFFKVMKPLCDDADLMICPKVRLEDLAEVTDKSNIYKWRGHIKSRHVDFIIADEALNVLAAIELDDSSHNSKKAQETDDFKNKFFVKIGIPLFRIKTGQDYNEAISNIIKALKFIIT